MIRKIVDKIKNEWERESLRKVYHQVYRRVSDYSMINPTIIGDNLSIFDKAVNVAGDVVECGVWRGGMSAAMAFRCQADRHFYLFDSFEGLPAPSTLDGEEAKEWATGKDPALYWDNCRAEMTYADTIMRQTGKPYTLIKGWFEETVPVFKPERPIAVLRLDGDWYDSTMVCLQHLYPKMAIGGLVIIDDYFTWDGCSRAIHDYLSAIKSRARIHRSQNGVCYFYRVSEESFTN